VEGVSSTFLRLADVEEDPPLLLGEDAGFFFSGPEEENDDDVFFSLARSNSFVLGFKK
jgi:hypothetical protein